MRKTAVLDPSGDRGVEPLLRVEGLQTWFSTDEGLARAVDGVSFDVPAARTVGVVGESGCGKSITALSIMRLIPAPPGEIRGGRILFRGRDLLQLDEQQMRSLRGREIAMIFQEPMTSLNPVFTVGSQIAEALRTHGMARRRAALERAIELMDLVGIPAAARRSRCYPHELSGGMRQRVMIAMALSCEPSLLIADEPTTALDVTIQAQILELLVELQERFGMAIQLITHDLSVIAETAHEVVVMYAGKVVERAAVVELFEGAAHPYTLGLLRSIPPLEGTCERLAVIPGSVPSAVNYPSGCRFRERCPIAEARCAESEPALRALGAGHDVACHLVD